MGMVGLLSREELPIYRWQKIISKFWWQDVLHSVLYIAAWHVALGIAAFLGFFSFSFNHKWQYDKLLFQGMGEWDIPVRILKYTIMSYGICFGVASIYGSKIHWCIFCHEILIRYDYILVDHQKDPPF